MAKRLFLGARKLVFVKRLLLPVPYRHENRGNKIILTFTETGKGLT